MTKYLIFTDNGVIEATSVNHWANNQDMAVKAQNHSEKTREEIKKGLESGDIEDLLNGGGSQE